MTYEIIKHLGILSEGADSNSNPMRKEVNIISWNRGTPVIDVRSWSENREVMTSGATFTKNEFTALVKCMKAWAKENRENGKA